LFAAVRLYVTHEVFGSYSSVDFERATLVSLAFTSELFASLLPWLFCASKQTATDITGVGAYKMIGGTEADGSGYVTTTLPNV